MASLVLFNGAKTQTGFLGIVCTSACGKANYSTEQPSWYRPLKTTNEAALKKGTGGRSSFSGTVATVFGCSGFVGRYVVNKLGKTGSQVILPYRADPYEVRHLKLMGDLGQILYHPFHLQDDDSIRKAMKYSNVVINLVGRDWETKNFPFKEVHVNGARRLARIARECGVEKFIHMSALNASPELTPIVYKGSKFLQSKYHSEQAVRDEFPDAIIIRPSDMFGSEDRFLNYYGHTWRRHIRIVSLWNNGTKTVKQPVYVGDVAQAIVNAIKDPDAVGKVFQAVGPRRYLLKELVDYFQRAMRKDESWGLIRWDLRFDPVFRAKVALTEALQISFPIGNLHHERVEREYVTDVVEKGIPTLEDLGVQLTGVEEIAPYVLKLYAALSYYDAQVGEFPKPAPPAFL